MFKVNLIFLMVATLLGQSYSSFQYSDDDSLTSWYYPEEINGVVDYNDPRADRNCSSAGIMCKNCNTTVLCVEVNNGVFEEHAPDYCQAGETCLETQCVTTYNPHCSVLVSYPYVCDRIGMFPDPFDCRRFHMCAPINTTAGGLAKYTALCDTGHKYNAKSTYCNDLLVGNQCYESINEFPVSQCTKNGQMAALEENKSIYYICERYPGKTELYPFMKLCLNGKVFDAVKMSCVEPDDLIEPTTTEGTSTS